MNDQHIYITPYNAKIFEFDTVNSRVYIGREINQLLTVFGDNCIIDGVEIKNVELIDNLLKININPGKIIIDTTLIEFKEIITLELDITSFDKINGFFTILIAYKYLQHNYDNYAKFRLIYVDKNNNSNFYFKDYDRICLTKITIDHNNIVNFTKSLFSNKEYITINKNKLKIYPSNSIVNGIISSIREMYRY